ncbi:hypothetical protein EZV62_014074 [Acer yangbiense]|uniref:Uncharacterized protein n=1 Tax=Acer yangbiense TaxID=1000413 RepID=A0A5C7HR21_9ROSI|nr:hypothetical protein EZV62_014074 [Acer yangbiense]
MKPSPSTSTARPMPLPLPLPLPEENGELRLPSPKDTGGLGRAAEERERDGFRDRDRVDGAAEGVPSSSFPITSVFSNRVPRISPEYLDKNSYRNVHRKDRNSVESSRVKFRLDIPFPECSTSPLWKPLLSPKNESKTKFGLSFITEKLELCVQEEVEMFPDDLKSAECIKQLEQGHQRSQLLVDASGVQGLLTLEWLNIKYMGSLKNGDPVFGLWEFSFAEQNSLHVVNLSRITKYDVQLFILSVLVSHLALDNFGLFTAQLTGQAADLSLKGSPYWMAPEGGERQQQSQLETSDLTYAPRSPRSILEALPSASPPRSRHSTRHPIPSALTLSLIISGTKTNGMPR